MQKNSVKKSSFIQPFKNVLIIMISVLMFLSAGVQTAFAQLPPIDPASIGEPIQNFAIPERMTDYEEAKSGASLAFYFVFIWRSLIFVAALMVIIYFVMASFEWITAQGEGAKIAAARNKMTGAIAGFIVLAGMFVILEFISSVFGLNLLQPTIPVPTEIAPAADL